MYTDKVKRVRQALSRFDYVQFTFCDINGVSRGKMQPVRNADDFQKGLTIYNGKTISLVFRSLTVYVNPAYLKI